MDDVLIYSETMTDIADAIRAKTGSSDPMLPRDMAGEIDSIDTSEAEARDIEWVSRTLESVTFPEGITEIGSYVFQRCTALVITGIPDSVAAIGTRAFYGCNGLPSVTFRGTPLTIASDAFSGCSRLLTLNVPWAEGEVAGAPWGATKATINYNYREADDGSDTDQ